MRCVGRTSDWLRKHVVIASAILLLCSALPRVYLTASAEPSQLLRPDSYSYLIPAFNLLTEGTFLDGKKKPEVTRTPGYPIFLMSIMSIVGRDLHEVLLVQAVLLSSGTVILYWFARRVLEPSAAFMGGLIAALSPWGALLSCVLLTEGLFLWLLSLIFLLMKLTEEAQRISHVVVLSSVVGLLTAAAVLVRPAWPLFVLVSMALFLQYGPRRKGVLVMLLFVIIGSTLPLHLWKHRNFQEAGFSGLSDISGKGAWWSLASRVTAQLEGKDRFEVAHAAVQEDRTWKLAASDADRERWTRASAVFEKHPVLTAMAFIVSAAEHAVHPSPEILEMAHLQFPGDYWAFASLWGVLIVLAVMGGRHMRKHRIEERQSNYRWLLLVLIICCLLTLSSGLSFGQGARYRAPLELIVPLLAGAGLLHLIDVLRRTVHWFPHRAFLEVGHVKK